MICQARIGKMRKVMQGRAVNGRGNGERISAHSPDVALADLKLARTLSSPLLALAGGVVPPIRPGRTASSTWSPSIARNVEGLDM